MIRAHFILPALIAAAVLAFATALHLAEPRQLPHANQPRGITK